MMHGVMGAVVQSAWNFGQMLYVKAAVDERNGCKVSATFFKTLGAVLIFGAPVLCAA